MTSDAGGLSDGAAAFFFFITHSDCGPSCGSKPSRFCSAERFLCCEAIEILAGLKRLRHKTQDAKKHGGTLNRDQRRNRGTKARNYHTAGLRFPKRNGTFSSHSAGNIEGPFRRMQDSLKPHKYLGGSTLCFLQEAGVLASNTKAESQFPSKPSVSILNLNSQFAPPN